MGVMARNAGTWRVARIRDALQQGRADAVACLPVPRAY
jgi:hypothetical protein